MPMPEGKRVPVNRLYAWITYEPEPGLKRGPTVGLIEDHPEIIAGLAAEFVREGHRVVGFAIDEWEHPTDMQQRALTDQIAQSGIEIAVIDSGLGYVNGIELSKRLKEVGMPTILLTGTKRTTENEDAADEFIPKPIDPSELVKIVREMLGISE